MERSSTLKGEVGGMEVPTCSEGLARGGTRGRARGGPSSLSQGRGRTSRPQGPWKLEGNAHRQRPLGAGECHTVAREGAGRAGHRGARLGDCGRKAEQKARGGRGRWRAPGPTWPPRLGEPAWPVGITPERGNSLPSAPRGTFLGGPLHRSVRGVATSSVCEAGLSPASLRGTWILFLRF